MWVLKWIQRRGTTPLGWHSQWKASGRLQDHEANVQQHESACRVLETSLCYDQINIATLASFELISRQLQIAEERLSHRFEDPSSDLVQEDYFLMSGAPHKSHLCVSPELRAWIAKERGQEASVLKERRKAREERLLARPKKTPKGGGRGGADE